MGMIAQLAPQVTALEIEYNITIHALVSGDPAYTDHIHRLVASSKKLFTSFKQMIEQMKSSSDTTDTIDKVSAIAMHKDPTAYVAAKVAITKSVTYFVKEIAAAISLFNSLMKLITNILSLQPILAVLISQLNTIKKATSASLVKVQNRIRITKQKADKSIQWALEVSQLESDELLERSLLEVLQANYSKVTNPDFKSQLEVQISDSTFRLLTEIPAKRNQLAKDKLLWKAKWDSDELLNAEVS